MAQNANDDQDPIERLARQLCTAYIASSLGISLAYAERKYTNQTDRIADYWMRLAERIQDDVHGSLMQNVLREDKPVNNRLPNRCKPLSRFR